MRELRQAATQSDGVASLLAQFQNAAPRAEQKALIDQLLTAWADTSGMAKNLDARAQGQYIIQYEAFGNERRSNKTGCWRTRKPPTPKTTWPTCSTWTSTQATSSPARTGRAWPTSTTSSKPYRRRRGEVIVCDVARLRTMKRGGWRRER